MWDENVPYSICNDFINAETELVNAWEVMLTVKQPNDVSLYRHYVNCCEKLEISNIVDALNQMITLDFIIANEDRHFNNFGLIRNAETLEWIGVAPIFDSGSSLGYEQLPAQIRRSAIVECKPFKKHHKDQIKLVTSFDWLDFSKLDGIGSEISEILSNERAAGFIDKYRISAIVDAVESRIMYVKELGVRMNDGTAKDSVEDDVVENIAKSYE